MCVTLMTFDRQAFIAKDQIYGVLLCLGLLQLRHVPTQTHVRTDLPSKHSYQVFTKIVTRVQTSY